VSTGVTDGIEVAVDAGAVAVASGAWAGAIVGRSGAGDAGSVPVGAGWVGFGTVGVDVIIAAGDGVIGSAVACEAVADATETLVSVAKGVWCSAWRVWEPRS